MILFTNTGTGRDCESLYPLNCGQQDCAPSYSFGPAVRDHYILHLVTEGKGRFTILGKTYDVVAGEFFFIPPDTLNYYEADAADPWSYTWVGLKGSILPSLFERMGISAQNPVGKFTSESAALAREICESRAAVSLALIGHCYLFLDALEKSLVSPKPERDRTSEYVATALSIIDQRLHKPTTVAYVAEQVGLDRSYLCSIFKKELGCSPQQYILKRKIEKAKYFLSSTSENVKYIALSLGYDDPFVFSRTFKQGTGMSPSQWRESCGEKK